MVLKSDPVNKITVTNMRLEHAQQVKDVIYETFQIPPDQPCEDCMKLEMVATMLERFPEGQFVALYHDGEKEIVVGIAITMRTNHPPVKGKQHRWWKFVGTYRLDNHEPDGEWLYGVEMAVLPAFRRRGIGSLLYQARFDMVKRLNLKGWYAGGMLMGYPQYKHEMSPREYGEKVIRGELKDPTVTLQQKLGFETWSVIEDYLDSRQSGNSAVLIVWQNPDYTAESA